MSTALADRQKLACGAKEIILWLPVFGGPHGFVRYIVTDPQQLAVFKPLSKKQELEQLKKWYELDDHRLYAGTPEVSFKEYCEVWRQLARKNRALMKKGVT